MAELRAAVIGSGFGGLAAAIRLAAAGVKVTVFEARDLPGGRAYVYRLGGYTFDAGPTVITAPHCIEELFELSGRRMSDYVELLPVTPFYRLHWTADGKSFDYDGDTEHMVEQIRSLRSGDVDGYRRFAALTGWWRWKMGGLWRWGRTPSCWHTADCTQTFTG